MEVSELDYYRLSKRKGTWEISWTCTFPKDVFEKDPEETNEKFRQDFKQKLDDLRADGWEVGDASAEMDVQEDLLPRIKCRVKAKKKG